MYNKAYQSGMISMISSTPQLSAVHIFKSTSVVTCPFLPILVIVAGDKKIDNHKYKDEFKVKAKMISFDDVETLIGHKAGGVCPFGINDNVRVYLDLSLKKYEYVYPACGTSNTAVKLIINELEKASKYIKWVDVCKEGE